MKRAANVHTCEDGWIGLGLCDGACHVLLTVPIDGQVSVASYLSPRQARGLAADLLRFASEAEKHPVNAGERRH